MSRSFNIKEFRMKKVGVLGFGVTGRSVWKELVRRGINTYVSDTGIRSLPRNVRGETGRHTKKILLCDLIIVSPGVDWDLPILREARERGISVWSEIEFAYRILEMERRLPRKVLAVTGTNGKTTTTSLLGKILQHANKPVVVAGNIGKAFTAVLPKINRKTWLVLELSSYQLEGIDRFQSDVGILLNVTPDHLGRHKTMHQYAQAKGKLFLTMKRSGIGIFNVHDQWSRKIAYQNSINRYWFSNRGRVSSGASFDGKHILLKMNNQNLQFESPRFLFGQHNINNVLAVICAAVSLGLPKSSVSRVLESFKGVPHRLEKVGKYHGVLYINDSKATNVSSTRVALEALPGPIHLIMGGRHKGNSYRSLKGLVKKKTKYLFLIGEAKNRIKKELGKLTQTIICNSLKNAVRMARRRAKKGEIVLLSPGCASFDQFKNFEHRGNTFKNYVRNGR